MMTKTHAITGLAAWMATDAALTASGVDHTGYATIIGGFLAWSAAKMPDDGTTVARTVEGICPPMRVMLSDVGFTDPEIEAARNRVYVAKADAEAALIAAQAQVDAAALLSQAASDAAYLEVRRIEAQLAAAAACAENPNCTLVVGAGGVIVGE